MIEDMTAKLLEAKGMAYDLLRQIEFLSDRLRGTNQVIQQIEKAISDEAAASKKEEEK